MNSNIDSRTVEGFGEEWNQFGQAPLSSKELQERFFQYFKVFPWDSLSQNAVGFDLGCGSGRWALCVAPKVKVLHCIDASEKALAVAKKNLSIFFNCQFHLASVDNIPLENNSMDFGYSLGVLHHVPDTAAGIRSCVIKLKRGAPFLLYIYYSFDNRPKWFYLLWRISDLLRKCLSKLPFRLKYFSSQVIAAFVYYPLARLSLLSEWIGLNVQHFPLSYYRHLSYYTMRTDAFDRFGTRLEQRFSADEIRQMMEAAGLEKILFSNSTPYWCAVGFKRS